MSALRYKLRSCVWEITLACCFSCRYCGSKAGRPRENELTSEECFSLADQLAQLGCQRVSLIGGEVFMRPDWAQIINRLTDNGIRTAVITNGFLFGQEHIKALISSGIESVSVSVDGMRALHDRYRMEGSFDRAMRAIDTLREAGVPVSVITTLNAENTADLEKLYGALVDKDIAAWQLQACSPMGNAASSGVDYRIDVGLVIRFVEEHMKKAPFLLGIADNIGYFTDNEGYLRGSREGNAPFGGCRAGLSAIGIDSIGNLRGCESMYDERFIEGNLRERSLRDIWEDPKSFSYNRGFTRDMLTGACKTCGYGGVCAGGCRSYNHFVHGKLYEAPFCARIASRDGK